MAHEEERLPGRISRERAGTGRNDWRNLGSTVNRRGDANGYTRLRPRDASEMQMVEHGGVERGGIAGKVPDLVVVTAVAGNEKGDYHDFRRPLPHQIGYNVLEPMGGSPRSHKEADANRPGQLDLPCQHLDPGVPLGAATVRYDDGAGNGRKISSLRENWRHLAQQSKRGQAGES